jgi:hypothetical protein
MLLGQLIQGGAHGGDYIPPELRIVVKLTILVVWSVAG